MRFNMGMMHLEGPMACMRVSFQSRALQARRVCRVSCRDYAQSLNCLSPTMPIHTGTHLEAWLVKCCSAPLRSWVSPTEHTVNIGTQRKARSGHLQRKASSAPAWL